MTTTRMKRRCCVGGFDGARHHQGCSRYVGPVTHTVVNVIDSSWGPRNLCSCGKTYNPDEQCPNQAEVERTRPNGWTILDTPGERTEQVWVIVTAGGAAHQYEDEETARACWAREGDLGRRQPGDRLMCRTVTTIRSDWQVVADAG